MMNTGQSLNKDLLKRVSGEFDLASITELNATTSGITALGVIGECHGLVYLDLSDNRISDLQPLESLKNLTTLDISCNRITCLVGLEGLESLESLNIAGNLITSIDSLQPLVNLEHLQNLRLQDKIKKLSNPVCQTLSQYKTSIFTFLSNLSMLDGERVSGAGADIFQMCDYLELKLNDIEREERHAEISNTNLDLQDLNERQHALLTSPKVEPKVAWSAERQFQDLLEQCQSLNQQADKTIHDAKHALWGTSKQDMEK